MQTQSPPAADTPAEAPPLTSAEFEALAIRLQRTARRAKSRACLAAFAIPTAFLWCLICRRVEGDTVPVQIPVFFVLVYVYMKRLLDQTIRKDAKEARRLVTFIENTRDARQLGALLDLREIVGHPSKAIRQVRRAAKKAAPRLLPLIQSTDADTLNTQQRASLRYDLFRGDLNSYMGYWPDTACCLPILCALEQIGDKRDLPDVERLLRYFNGMDEVREAAERCAEVIRERVARENLKDVLLRPDHNPDAPTTLLRPSLERADTAPQQLLRAAVSDHAEPPA